MALPMDTFPARFFTLCYENTENRFGVLKANLCFEAARNWIRTYSGEAAAQRWEREAPDAFDFCGNYVMLTEDAFRESEFEWSQAPGADFEDEDFS